MGCPSKGMSHQPIDTSDTLTTPLMQGRFKVLPVAQVYAKRENILAPHLCHENGTGLTPACRSQTAVGRRAWGSSYALRTRQVGVCNCNFNRVVSHFCRSRALRDFRLKGRGRLSWRPLLISPIAHPDRLPIPRWGLPASASTVLAKYPLAEFPDEKAHNACGELLQPRGVALVQNITPAGAAAAGV